jgi:aminodeoxyfutalosine deaminase
VHNTYTSAEEILSTKNQALNKLQTSNLKLQTSDIANCLLPTANFFYCLCPNANLYIENTLPDIEMLIKANAKITIGTDSLASNHQLSILEELKTISNSFPNIKLQTLLTWATKNGAEFLGFDKELGTIEKGKKPGLVWVKEMEKSKLLM